MEECSCHPLPTPSGDHQATLPSAGMGCSGVSRVWKPLTLAHSIKGLYFNLSVIGPAALCG